jgi:hypothetical protein
LENLNERDYVDNTGTDQMTFLKCILKKQNVTVDWTHLVQGKSPGGGAILNMTKNF